MSMGELVDSFRYLYRNAWLMRMPREACGDKTAHMFITIAAADVLTHSELVEIIRRVCMRIADRCHYQNLQTDEKNKHSRTYLLIRKDQSRQETSRMSLSKLMLQFLNPYYR